MAPGESLRIRVAGWVSGWWSGEGGAAGTALHWLLLPAELAYRGVIRVRNEAFDRALLESASAPVPVISVGNIGVGGSGKTPFAAWVAARYLAWGHRPAIALRGYGRDEVLVHRELNPEVPVFAAAHRIRAVEAAAGAGCNVVILDDGFQHRQLERDLDIVLVSEETWAASRRHLLPRGPWREGAGSVRRADLVVAVRKSGARGSANSVAHEIRVHARAGAVVCCRIEPSHLTGVDSRDPVALDVLRGERVLAVAALASPESFVANLEAAGAVVELAAFPDHHEFTAQQADVLTRRAAGRRILLTHKDAVKLRHFWSDDERALVLHQAVRIEGGGEILESALRRIASMIPG